MIRSKKTFNNTDGTKVVPLDGGTGIANTVGIGGTYNTHQISVNKGGNTSGTITYLCTPVGAATTEAVYESGSAIVVNLATAGEPLTRTNIKGCITSFSFTQASLSGGGDVTYTISSWNE